MRGGNLCEKYLIFHVILGSYGPTIKTSNNLVYNSKPLQNDL